MTRTVGTHKGFAFDYEKRRAVNTLRALHHEARVPLDPDAIKAYALTLGWREKDARQLAKIAEGVVEGRRFMGVGGMIRRDPEVERRTVEMWRRDLEEGTRLSSGYRLARNWRAPEHPARPAN